jgi:hypothetical protein
MDDSVSRVSIIFVLLANSDSEKFAKKVFGESEIEDILQRLDRLTLEEARMTGTQTLQVVHSLVTNMKLVMDGMHLSLVLFLTADKIFVRQTEMHL